MTLYLKYRPQTIEELDLGSVRESLGKILEAKDLPHAWLLTGGRGTGKTSTARIIAKRVNCLAQESNNPKIQLPCNKCEMCREITEGRAVDVVEIDAASNRGIDDIRALREKIALAPMKAKYKVFIIDEAHMLTTEAENALLKTLEEPPANTLFFLCTTEEDKLLETVVSRCVKIQFGRPSIKEIADKLLRVAKGEKFKLEQEEADYLAKKARGSFRDGIKLLEQSIMAGKVEIERQNGILELVLENKRDEAIAEIEKLAEKGTDFRNLIENLTHALHQNLLVSKDIKLIGLIEGLQVAYERTKTAVVEQMPLEVWVIENTAKNPNIQEAKNPNIQEAKKKGKQNVFTLEDLNEKWGEILKKVKPLNHSVEALLRSTKPLDFDGEKMTLEVFYQFHYDKLNTDRCRQIVEVSVGEVFNHPPIKLFMKMGQKSKKQEEISAKGVEEDVISAAEAIFNATAI